jgi:hypothetical protein
MLAGWGQVRWRIPRRQATWKRHLHFPRRSQVSAAWVSWQGRGSSRPRQSTSRRAGEAGVAQEQSTPGPTAAAGRGRARAGVRARRVRPGEGCACLWESSACGGVCDGGACSRACGAEGRGQVVLARGGGCVRACECVEAGRGLTGVCGCLGGGLLGFYVAGWGQVRRGLARRPQERTRHLHLSRRSQVSAEWVSWQGRGSSRPRQSTRRRAGEASAAGGGVCVPVRELSVWGRV